jgi:hypothetical protein
MLLDHKKDRQQCQGMRRVYGMVATVAMMIA